MSKYIRWFKDLTLQDVSLVGGKNASLGELTRSLTEKDINIPDGFAITADAYTALLDSHGVADALRKLFGDIDKEDVGQLNLKAQEARSLIKRAGLPAEIQEEIRLSYQQLGFKYGPNPDVAVRSSATAEDLPEASFAGQQESFLNIRGEGALLEACLNCFASLFTERAISYRIDKGFDQMSVRLSVGVQKMVRSDLASAGVIFTLDTESGFKDVVLITSAYGLGENVVGGRVDPDEFLVFKPTLKTGFKPILKKKTGNKQYRLVYTGHGSRTTVNVNVPPEEREQLSLTDEEVLLLSRWACLIEEHYSKIHGRPTPMDIEWAKDG
ncbi:MAG TPA: PEP/pyruvate-binding domain-containing protein, partial [Candidatus Obscuribacterales bacterium]